MSQEAHALKSEVPRINDLRVLRMLRLAKDKNHARFALAAVCMIRLHEGAAGRTRSVLFAPIAGVKETKTLATEGKASSWQGALLDRLEESGLITWIDGVCAVPPDRRDEFASIAASPFSGDGLSLKRLLWPGDYAEPDSGMEPDPEEVANSEGESQLVSELTGTLRMLVETMGATLASVAKLNDNMVELEKRLGTKVDDVQRAVAAIEAVAAAFSGASERYDNLIRLLEDEDRRNLATLTEKVSALNERARSVAAQLDGVTTKESDVISKIKELLERRNS